MKKISVWQEFRFSIYFAFIINGILIQWIVPVNYICNDSDKKCFACGLRTAVDLLLQGKFVEAYNSNKLIIVLVLFVAVIIIDVLLFVYRISKKPDNTF